MILALRMMRSAGSGLGSAGKATAIPRRRLASEMRSTLSAPEAGAPVQRVTQTGNIPQSKFETFINKSRLRPSPKGAGFNRELARKAAGCEPRTTLRRALRNYRHVIKSNIRG